MMRTLKKPLALTLAFALLFATLPAYAGGADAQGEIDQMINSDAKLRTGRIIVDSIKEDRAAGKPIDLGKIKDRVANKPLLTHFLIEQAGEQGGNIFQFGLAGACPPYGLIAGTVIGSVMGSLGGSIGYATSQAMERGEKLDARSMFGNALKSIDMPAFIGRNAGSIIGATIGQALIPIPFVGMVAGNIVGGLVGGIAVQKLRRIGVIDRAADKLQSQWLKVGEGILAGGQKEPEASARGSRIVDAAPSATGGAETVASGSGAPLPVASVKARLASGAIAPAAGDSAALRAAYDEYNALHARYTKLAETARPDDPAFVGAGEKLDAARKRYLELSASE